MIYHTIIIVYRVAYIVLQYDVINRDCYYYLAAEVDHKNQGTTNKTNKNDVTNNR